MGTFNSGCAVSSLPILGGERVVVLLLVRQKEYQHGPCYPTDLWAPALLPVRGYYDEYGGLENIDDTKANRCAELFNCAAYKVADTETLLELAHDGKLSGRMGEFSPMKVLVKEEIWDALCAAGADKQTKFVFKKALSFLREAHKISPDFVTRLLNNGWDEKSLSALMALEGKENNEKLIKSFEKLFPNNKLVHDAIFPVSQIFTPDICGGGDIFGASFSAKLRQSVLTFSSAGMGTLMQECLEAHAGLSKLNRLWTPALAGGRDGRIDPEILSFNRLITSLSQTTNPQPR